MCVGGLFPSPWLPDGETEVGREAAGLMQDLMWRAWQSREKRSSVAHPLWPAPLWLTHCGSLLRGSLLYGSPFQVMNPGHPGCGPQPPPPCSASPPTPGPFLLAPLHLSLAPCFPQLPPGSSSWFCTLAPEPWSPAQP